MEPPAYVACPFTDVPLRTDNDSYFATYSSGIMATDARDGLLFATDIEQFDVGTTYKNYRAVDAAGNEAWCNFTITVTDTQAPWVRCPDPDAVIVVASLLDRAEHRVYGNVECDVDLVQGSSRGADWIPANGASACVVGAGDNVWDGQVHLDVNVTVLLDEGLHWVEYAVTDGAGLTTTCVTRVLVPHYIGT